MSFSREVKDELIEVRLRRDSDGVKLLSGATLAAASLKYSRSSRSWGLHYVSESASVINFIAKIASRSYGLENEISLNIHERLNARNTELFLYGSRLDDLCTDSGLFSLDAKGDKTYDIHMPEGLESEHSCRAFIRGIFLVCGSVSDPKSGCHAEMVLKNEFMAKETAKLLSDRGIPPKVSKRKNQWIVYMKNGDTVEDFLTFMGAGESMLAVREHRMIREAKNNSNREVNCFNANMDKTAKAAAAQIEDIELIMTERGADFLSEDLYEVASARMNEPELTLTELAEKLSIGRSAVNYRLKKIGSIANDIRNGII